MLNTTKLLYIFPDVAYVAELLAGKKPHTFGVHSFRQVNGEFISGTAFINKNVLKLFSKLEEGEYTLVLPDNFFTNTIITIDETNDEKIQSYIETTTLPQLQLSKKTHHLESYVLTEFKGKSQIQIAALEKKKFAPIRAAASQTAVSLSATIALSWSIKSLISLEPSVSIVQAGSDLYIAKHYIGIDDTVVAPVTDLSTTVETVKSLKGTDANIQTVYLVCNELIESTLKEELSEIIPLQQLASHSEEETQMPSYIKQVLEATGRTLSISEYPVPRFMLEEATAADLQETNIETLAVDDEPKPAEPVHSLPAPTELQLNTPTILPTIPTLGEEIESEEIESEEADLPELALEPKTASETLETAVIAEKVAEKIVEKEEQEEEIEKVSTKTEIETAHAIDRDTLSSTSEDVTKTAVVANTKSETIDLTKFSKHDDTAKTDTMEPTKKVSPPIQKNIIKNTSGVHTMLKMILITTLVFIVTVAIGVGVGLGILSFANKSTTQSPVVTESPAPTAEPTPSATPSPSPEAVLDKSTYSILVVNATTKAGYAGTISDKLKGYKTIKAGNSKGTYTEKTSLVSLKTATPGLIEALNADTGMTLTESDTALKTEDAAGTYDAVIVLLE